MFIDHRLRNSAAWDRCIFCQLEISY